MATRTKSLLLAFCLLLVFAPAAFADASPGARWEQALLTAKKHGSLPGPRPGQKCLWSKSLGGCLWYTPAKWSWRNYRLPPLGPAVRPTGYWNFYLGYMAW
jgi:hypothetical protein